MIKVKIPYLLAFHGSLLFLKLGQVVGHNLVVPTSSFFISSLSPPECGVITFEQGHVIYPAFQYFRGFDFLRAAISSTGCLHRLCFAVLSLAYHNGRGRSKDLLITCYESEGLLA